MEKRKFFLISNASPSTSSVSCFLQLIATFSMSSTTSAQEEQQQRPPRHLERVYLGRKEKRKEKGSDLRVGSLSKTMANITSSLIFPGFGSFGRVSICLRLRIETNAMRFLEKVEQQKVIQCRNSASRFTFTPHAPQPRGDSSIGANERASEEGKNGKEQNYSP